jgi:hypothetical protein
MKIALVITFLIFSNYWLAHSQTSTFNKSIQPYLIDSSITKILNERTKQIKGKSYGSVDFNLFVNDSLFDENHSMDRGYEYPMIVYLVGDTIKILGKPMFGGFAYRISLLANGAIVQFIVYYEEKIFKLAQSDSLSNSLTIYCTDFKLTLSRYPEFEKGKIVEGIIEFSTPEYLTVENGIEEKNKMETKAYFKSDIK